MIKKLTNSFPVLLSVFRFEIGINFVKKKDWIAVTVKKIFQISNSFLKEIVR